MRNADEEQQLERRVERRSSFPTMTAEEREHIEKVARFVAREIDGGDLFESILLRLHMISGNDSRWGFLNPDHHHHLYYINRKVAEQCRFLQTRRQP